MTATSTPPQTETEEALGYLRNLVAAGEHWYIGVLKTMARWSQSEEVIEGRHYRYLVGGEAFDWLLLAERLIDELDGLVGERERNAFLSPAHPPLEMDEEE